MTAGELKAVRVALGLGPVAMAARLGMTYQNYWRLEQGAGRIRQQIALLVGALEAQGRGENQPHQRGRGSVRS